MLITQTPLRISFFGGGTDLPAYYREFGGCVLSATINKYVYVIASRRFDDLIRVGYSKTELVESVDLLEHDLIREALRMTGTKRGIEINTIADIPGSGSGLGSSSAVTVGTLLALYALHTYPPDVSYFKPEHLAREACKIEIDTLAHPIGKQDQYATACGGMNFIQFEPDGQVTVSRLNTSIPPETFVRLENNLLLFYTGIARKSGSVLSDQQSRLYDHLDDMAELKDIAATARRHLERGDLSSFGDFLDWTWRVKKRLSGKISNPQIDEWYEAAKQAGAQGGKLCGAGGGGFLLLYAPPDKQDSVRNALPLRELPFQFEPTGSQIIFRKLESRKP